MGGANSRHSNNSILTKKELERMQRRLAPFPLAQLTSFLVLEP